MSHRTVVRLITTIHQARVSIQRCGIRVAIKQILLAVKMTSLDDEQCTLDKNHLADQAVKLFSKRYAKAFDTHVDVRRSGHATKDEYLKFCIRSFDDDMRAKALKIANKQWFAVTGGRPETKTLTRKRFIAQCIEGYHSTDLELRDKLKHALTEVADFHFDLIDADGDGNITPDEWSKWTRMLGNPETWKGAFATMDLNGDGKIERNEWTQCFVGFFCYIDEERYSHFFGLIH